MGGLMQLIAYGALDVYLPTFTINNNRDNNNYCNNNTIIDDSKTIKENFNNLRRMVDPIIKTHKNIINNINLTNPYIIPVLKNTECPITYSEITGNFIECTVCKTCYDYTNTEVITWFNSHRNCSICRGKIDKTIKNINGYDAIYSTLKLKTNK
jgi:hypothetical protein